MAQAKQSFTGLRILEAMRSAVLYSETVFAVTRGAVPPSASELLDFGAGDGLFAEKFRAQGLIVDCVEPDPSLQERLQGVAAKIYSDTSEIKNAAYDFIYTINVLEHISNLDEVCQELFRVLRPQGTLFVFVPALEILWTHLDDEVGHVRRFRRGLLSDTLQHAGFVVRKIEYFDSLGFPAALAVRLLEKFNLFSYNASTVGFYDRNLFPISRALDHVFKGILGKNLIAIAGKPD